jgi:DNA-binding NtrC family response regulator
MENYILIVEDNIRWQRLLRRILAGSDYHPLVASNVEDANHLLDQYLVKLVILDINLTDTPENQDGVDFMEHLHEVKPGIPIIIVSGTLPRSYFDLRDKWVNCDYLSKTDLSSEALLNAVEQLIEV